MEGKGCLFKKFAGIDVFDIEIDETDPDKLVETIASLEPTFGGINLEDIKAPECFEIERKLRARMKIPVFHDDQHGTAIVAAAALLNALQVVGKEIGEVKLVCSGAGAAAIACLDLVVGLGVRRENVWVTDSKGVVYEGPHRARWTRRRRATRRRPSARTLAEIIEGADVFLGLSAGGRAQAGDGGADGAAADHPGDGQPRPGDPARGRPRRCGRTASSPPAARDYPNQVNNVLCFPFIFRGALDVGATTINEEMKLACVRAIAELAQAERPTWWPRPMAGRTSSFGPDYLIPPPVRPAPDHDRGARGGRGRDGERRRDPPDRRHRGLSRSAAALRLHAPAP